MVAMLLLALWAAMAVAPETPIARFLRRGLVERPAAALARLTRRQVAVALALATLALLLAWCGAGDGLRVLGMAAPEAWAWISAVGVSVYLDALIAVAAASSVMRAKALGARLPVRIRRLARRPAAGPRAKRRPRRPRPAPANDDAHGADFALAA